MRYFSLFFLFTILFTSCEKEEEPEISPLPHQLRGTILKSAVSREPGETRWVIDDYMVFFISDDGKYYSMDQGSERICEGSINWHMEDGDEILEFNSEDGANDRIFKVIEMDENHLLGEIEWGNTYKEYLFSAGESNLAGVVMDASSYEPLTNAYVIVKEEQGDDYHTITSVYTDKNGYFGIHSKNFSELFNASHVSIYEENHADIAEKEIRVDLESTHFYHFKMEQGESSLNKGWVYGTVKDEKTGTPIADAEISYDDPSETVKTSMEGEYEILVPEGFHVITASHEDYQSLSQNIAVNSLQRQSLNFLLKPAGSGVTGSVITSGGSGVGNAVMELEDENGSSVVQVTSESDGTFSFEGIPDGTYVINISVEGMQVIPQNYPLTVSGGNVSDIQFLAVPEGTTAIGGRVTGWDDDSPVANTSMSVLETSTSSNSGGYYLMELSTTGSKILKASKANYINRYKEVNIKDGELLQKNLNLATEGNGANFTFYGTVRDSDTGDGLGGVNIEVEGHGSTTTASDGTFSIDLEVYDETINQIIYYTSELNGHETEGSYLFFYIDTYFGTDIYMVKSK